MMRNLISILVILFSTTHCFAQNHKVSVNCKVNDKGTLYVLLVDSETFKTPLHSVQKQIIVLNNNNRNIEITFGNVTSGQYGIRCFIDTNDNGKLDRGLFGPSEPWGMSWNREKHKTIPSFDQISHAINSDYTFPAITLKK